MMPRLMLHAQQLSFTHPESGQLIDISCPSDFEHLLQA
jgi:23S rRNA-/tRNA-specific pseudouridylate synthase